MRDEFLRMDFYMQDKIPISWFNVQDMFHLECFLNCGNGVICCPHPILLVVQILVMATGSRWVTVGIHIMYIVLHPIGEFFNHVPAAVKCHKFYANAYRDTEPPFKVIFERCMTFIFDAPHLENYLC